jgi:hypothetical protein
MLRIGSMLKLPLQLLLQALLPLLAWPGGL